MTAAGLGRKEDDDGQGETDKECVPTGGKNGENKEQGSQKLGNKIVVVVHSNYGE